MQERTELAGRMNEGLWPTLEWMRITGRSRVFDQAVPVGGDEDGANLNVIQAVEGITGWLESEAGLLIGVIGPMASGKTTSLVKLCRWGQTEGRRVQVWKQAFDALRVGGEKALWVQSQNHLGGKTTEYAATLYYRLQDLIDRIQWQEGDVQVIDEVMFAGVGDPPVDDLDTLNRLKAAAGYYGGNLVVAGLHSDFAGRLWPNIKGVLTMADRVVDLRGRCDCPDCHQPSVMTQRYVQLGVGGQVEAERPSHMRERVVRPGSVLGLGDKYRPMCRQHHQVWEPEAAKQFDQQYDVDMRDYGNRV